MLKPSDKILKTTASLAVAATLISGIGIQPAMAEDTAPTTPDTSQTTPDTGTDTPSTDTGDTDTGDEPQAVTYTATLNGKTIELTGSDTAISGTFDKTDAYPGEVTVNGSDGSSFTLSPSETSKTQATFKDGTIMGTGTITGTANYHNSKTDPDSIVPAIAITVPFEYSTGSEITINTGSDAIPFTLKDNVWTATDSNFTLDNANTPSGDTVTLSNGDTARIAWNASTTTVTKDNGTGGTARFVRKTGTATGTVTGTDPTTGRSGTQNYSIDVMADRAEDTTISKVQVNRVAADGTKTVAYETAFDASKHDITATELAADQVGDTFTLSFENGVDAVISTPSMTLGANASRVFTFTANGQDYTLTVPFKTAEINDLDEDSPAKLEGIYVNYSGENTKGELITNWNANRLNYIIQLGENDPSPYVLPVAADGVTVQAGDLTQNAQGARQEWKVTDTATGKTRTYSVTSVRPVETAVTKFKPADPIAQKTTVAPENDNDAALASHGYVTKDGKYVTVTGNTYTIPEGGTFSYEGKNGQSISVSSSHSGMTYTYTVTVLPKNTSAAPKQERFTVTYITAETSKAELTGLKVNGIDVEGFSPDKKEYTVAVGDLDQWTVTPLYDKTTGMSVSVHKDGQTATITVTSGDGLTKTEYKVTVTQRMKLVGGELASTGVAIIAVVGVAAALLLCFIILTVLKRMKFRDEDKLRRTVEIVQGETVDMAEGEAASETQTMPQVEPAETADKPDDRE